MHRVLFSPDGGDVPATPANNSPTENSPAPAPADNPPISNADPNSLPGTVETVTAGELLAEDSPAPAEKRGRGRPAGSLDKVPRKKPSRQITRDANGKFAPPDFSDLPPADSTIDDTAEIPSEEKTGTVENPPGTQTAGTVDYKKNAAMTFDSCVNILSLIGPEWRPQSWADATGKIVRSAEEERAGMIEALARVYESEQMPDIPPKLCLAIMAIAYAAPRFGQPATQSFVRRVVDHGKRLATWLSGFVSGFFRRRGAAPTIQPANDPQPEPEKKRWFNR